MRDREAERIGRRLHADRLVSANFGNLSVRDGAGFFIKRKYAYLDGPGSLVFVPLEGEVPEDASRETVVHREIYRITRAGAIVHAHPPHAIALSYLGEEVKPCDCVGEMLCRAIPVVEGASGTPVLARVVAEALRAAPAVLVRGHGTFAVGSTLDEAYAVTSAVEHACHILVLLNLLKK